MKIGLDYDLKNAVTVALGAPDEEAEEYDPPSTIDALASEIERLGHQVVRLGGGPEFLENLGHTVVDFVFNISEGLSGRNRESQVPMLLEMDGIPFVGADALSLALTLDKVMAKKVFIADKIPTPKFFEIKNIEALQDTDHMKFPLIVKPRFEGSSKGLSESSRVENMDELKKQADYVISTYKQPALVEEFISGQEFTVLVIGNEKPIAAPIVQISIGGTVDLGDKFYTFGHVHSHFLKYICPAKIPDKLRKDIEDVAIRSYKSLECLDFGRVDIRVSEDGLPYVLEINPLPSLSTADVIPLIGKEMGIGFGGMILRILNYAFKRYGL